MYRTLLHFGLYFYFSEVEEPQAKQSRTPSPVAPRSPVVPARQQSPPARQQSPRARRSPPAQPRPRQNRKTILTRSGKCKFAEGKKKLEVSRRSRDLHQQRYCPRNCKGRSES